MQSPPPRLSTPARNLEDLADQEAAALREQLARTDEAIQGLQRQQAATLHGQLSDPQQLHPPQTPEAALALDASSNTSSPTMLRRNERLAVIDEDDPSDLANVPSIQETDPLTDSVLQLLEWIRTDDPEASGEALDALSEMLSFAYGGDGAIIGEVMRRHGGLRVLVDHLEAGAPDDVCHVTLLLLGNLCSDAVDPNSRLSKRALLRSNADSVLFMQLASEDHIRLALACGVIQNLTLDASWAEMAMQRGADRMLGALLAHPNEQVVQYATGALSNITRSHGSSHLPFVNRKIEERAWQTRLQDFRQRVAWRIIKASVAKMATGKWYERAQARILAERQLAEQLAKEKELRRMEAEEIARAEQLQVLEEVRLAEKKRLAELARLAERQNRIAQEEAMGDGPHKRILMEARLAEEAREARLAEEASGEHALASGGAVEGAVAHEVAEAEAEAKAIAEAARLKAEADAKAAVEKAAAKAKAEAEAKAAAEVEAARVHAEAEAKAAAEAAAAKAAAEEAAAKAAAEEAAKLAEQQLEHASAVRIQAGARKKAAVMELEERKRLLAREEEEAQVAAAEAQRLQREAASIRVQAYAQGGPAREEMKLLIEAEEEARQAEEKALRERRESQEAGDAEELARRQAIEAQSDIEMAAKAAAEAEALLREANAVMIQAAGRGMSSRQDLRATMAAREAEQAAKAAEAAADAVALEKAAAAKAAQNAVMAKVAEEKADGRAHQEAEEAEQARAEALAARAAEEVAERQLAEAEAAAAAATEAAKMAEDAGDASELALAQAEAARTMEIAATTRAREAELEVATAREEAEAAAEEREAAQAQAASHQAKRIADKRESQAEETMAKVSALEAAKEFADAQAETSAEAAKMAAEAAKMAAEAAEAAQAEMQEAGANPGEAGEHLSTFAPGEGPAEAHRVTAAVETAVGAAEEEAETNYSTIEEPRGHMASDLEASVAVAGVASDEEQAKAAVRVQAVQRGRNARSNIDGERQHERRLLSGASPKFANAPPTIEEGTSPDKGDAASSDEMEKAATKVQSVQRGRLARKHATGEKGGAFQPSPIVGVRVDHPLARSAMPVAADMPTSPKHALFIVNVQNDYIDGTLAMRYTNAHREGYEVVPVINSIRTTAQIDLCVMAKTWLPAHHCGFYESNVGREIPKRPKSPNGRMRAKIARKLQNERELLGDDAPPEELVAENDDVIIVSAPEEGYVAGMRRNAMEFDATDVDNDRQLDFNEFCRMVREREEGEHTNAELQDRFEAIDQDGSGKISMNEYVYFALCECLLRSGQRVVDLFKLWDDDNSGLIDKAEFRRAIKAMGFALYVNDAEIDMVFDDFDEDKLGAIDYKELNAALRKIKLPTASLKKTEPRKNRAAPEVRVRMKTNEEAQDFIRKWLADHKQRVIDLFKDWDEDGNGTIDEKEFRHGLAALGIRMRSDKVASLFETLDKDSSGEIDYNELIIGLQQRKSLKELPQGPRHFSLPPLHDCNKVHISDADLYDRIYIDSPYYTDGLPLTLLPRHCEQFTWGSRPHDQLRCSKSDAVVMMGTAPAESGQAVFSAFRNVPNPPDMESETAQFLRSQGITHLYVCGLALDYCVAHTALDAAAAGFAVTVVEDACQGTSTLETRRKLKLLDAASIQRIAASEMVNHQQRCSMKDVELAIEMAPKAKQLADELTMQPAYAKIAEPDELTETMARGSEAAHKKSGGERAALRKIGLQMEARVAELKQRQAEGKLTREEEMELRGLEGQLIEMKRAEELRRRSQEGGLTPDEKDELQRLELELANRYQDILTKALVEGADKDLYDELRNKQAAGTLTPDELAELQYLESRITKEPDSSAPPSSSATTQPSRLTSRLNTADKIFRSYDKDGDGVIDEAEHQAMVAAIDKDGDGKMDKSEFEAFMAAARSDRTHGQRADRSAHSTQPTASGAHLFDKDGDGQLDADELQALRAQVFQGLDPALSEEEKERIVSNVVSMMLASGSPQRVRPYDDASEAEPAAAFVPKPEMPKVPAVDEARLKRFLFHEVPTTSSLPPIKGASPKSKRSPQAMQPPDEDDSMRPLRVAALSHGRPAEAMYASLMDPRLARHAVEAAVARREAQWQQAIEVQLRHRLGRDTGGARGSPHPPPGGRGKKHAASPRAQRQVNAGSPLEALAPVPLWMGMQGVKKSPRAGSSIVSAYVMGGGGRTRV